MKKKILALGMAVCMAASLTACGNGSSSQTTTAADTTAVETTATETAAGSEAESTEGESETEVAAAAEIQE